MSGTERGLERNRSRHLSQVNAMRKPSHPMLQLEARPLGLFLNGGYGVYQGSKRIAKIKFGNGLSSFLGAFDILGISLLWDRGYRGWVLEPSNRYRVREKSRFFKAKTCLLQGKTVVTEAEDQLIPPVITFTHNDVSYRVERDFKHDYLIKVDGKVVGYVDLPRAFPSRKVTFQIPGSLPHTSQLLLMWLCLEKNSPVGCLWSGSIAK